jgi:hypothetical protein
MAVPDRIQRNLPPPFGTTRTKKRPLLLAGAENLNLWFRETQPMVPLGSDHSEPNGTSSLLKKQPNCLGVHGLF